VVVSAAAGGFQGQPLSLADLKEWLGHKHYSSTRHYAAILRRKLSAAYRKADYFARNVRTIQVLIDRETILSGVEQMLERLDLTDDERTALEGDREALTALAERLAKVPTPAGPTPEELGADRAFIELTAVQDSITGRTTMNAQSLLGFVREQALAVDAAEQDGEPGEVRTELNDVVSATSDESTQRLAEPSRVNSKPVMHEPQQLGQLGRVAGVQVHRGHEEISPPAQRSSPWRPAQAGRSAVDHDQLVKRVGVHVWVQPRLVPPGTMEPEGPVRAVRADDAPHRDRFGPRADKPDHLQGKAQPMTQHQDLVRLGDDRLAVPKRSDVDGHHVIQVEAARGALPAGQIRAARAGRLNLIGVPGEGQGRAMPNNTLSHQLAQLRRQLRHRHSDFRPCLPKSCDRQLVHPNIQHSAKRASTHPTDAREYQPTADRYRIFAITCPFHGNAGWRWIRDNDSDRWAKSISTHSRQGNDTFGW
jgi:hypothetical protein